MKPIRIVYSPTASAYLKHLHPDLKRALRETIEELAQEPNKGKPLYDEFEGFRSHRLKQYRAIYRYRQDHNLVEILFAGPRKDVYRLFSNYLKTLKH